MGAATTQGNVHLEICASVCRYASWIHNGMIRLWSTDIRTQKVNGTVTVYSDSKAWIRKEIRQESEKVTPIVKSAVDMKP